MLHDNLFIFPIFHLCSIVHPAAKWKLKSWNLKNFYLKTLFLTFNVHMCVCCQWKINNSLTCHAKWDILCNTIIVYYACFNERTPVSWTFTLRDLFCKDKKLKRLRQGHFRVLLFLNLYSLFPLSREMFRFHMKLMKIFIQWFLASSFLDFILTKINCWFFTHLMTNYLLTNHIFS